MAYEWIKARYLHGATEETQRQWNFNAIEAAVYEVVDTHDGITMSQEERVARAQYVADIVIEVMKVLEGEYN